MGTVRVFTKQHRAVLERLQRDGRYAPRGSEILRNEDALLMKAGYDWLARALPQEHRPKDADYPVWLSFRSDTAMLPTPGSVLLELEVDERLITRINVAKWGMINNGSYLPLDEADGRRHAKKMEQMGLSDAKVCMTSFYPELRQEIETSWMRLFDDAIQVGGPHCYGVIWEVQEEWIRKIVY